MAKLTSTAPHFRLVLLGALALFCAQALAQPAESYGKRFVRDGASWPAEAVPEPQQISTRSDPVTAQRLRERLDELELQSGPYAASLSEPLADLARALDANGRYEEAAQQRGRALHLLRVNEGLYSPTQVPLLQDQLAADRRRGDFEALDARYNYYFRLFGNALPPYTSLRFAATMEYFRWQREALRRELDGSPFDRLEDLLRAGDELIERLEESEPPVEPALLRDAVLNQLRSYFLFADLVQPAQDLDPWRVANPAAARNMVDFDPMRDRLEQRRRGLRARGDALLGDLLERMPAVDAAALDRALLLRERGDWALWWGSEQTALQWYRSSWEVLVGAGHEAVAERWFSEATPLPDNGVFLDPAAAVAGVARVQLTVDERGSAKAMLLDSQGELPRDVRRLPELIRKTRFRPALADGQAVQWSSDSWRFVAYD